MIPILQLLGRYPRIFPTMMVGLSILSAIAWLAAGNPRKAIYWAAAAVLTASVTY